MGQGRAQGFTGAGAVTQAAFFFCTEFGGRTLEAAHPEQSVIAKASLSARAGEYVAFPIALAENGGGILRVTHQRQYTVVASGAGMLGQTLELGEQPGIIFGVAGSGSSKARRVDARASLQGVYFDTRVVGQCRQAGHATGVAGLEDRVLDKTQSGFFCILYCKGALGQ